jgi:hypothetical protein
MTAAEFDETFVFRTDIAAADTAAIKSVHAERVKASEKTRFSVGAVDAG